MVRTATGRTGVGPDHALTKRIIRFYDADGRARTRFVDDAHRGALIATNLQIPATVLVGGWIAGIWRIDRVRKTARLALTAFDGIPSNTRRKVEDEAGPLR